MKSIELIIFDLDGTLVDSQEGIVQGINFALEAVGLKQKMAQEISSYIGTGEDDLIKKSLGQGQEALFTRTKAIFENYRRSHPNSSPLYPGAKDVLEYFKQKRKVIITNRKHEFALITLEALGINDYFAEIIGEDDIGCKKPSACPLDYAVTRFGMDKTKTMIVGDMDIDVLAGKKAGILTCGVTYGIGKKKALLQAKPDFIIDNILKLKEIID